MQSGQPPFLDGQGHRWLAEMRQNICQTMKCIAKRLRKNGVAGSLAQEEAKLPNVGQASVISAQMTVPMAQREVGRVAACGVAATRGLLRL